MRIDCIGGGPAGLYAAALIKKRRPAWRVRVVERNREGDTFGFGVVFSDQTLATLRAEDAESHDAITARFAHWNDIDVVVHDERLRASGHGFSGLSRRALLEVLGARARAVGVELAFGVEATADELVRDGADVVIGADGVNSRVRDASPEAFGPSVDFRKSRFVWLGTTVPFEAFTFLFRHTPAGMFQVHAYRYDAERSTFIVECTAETLERAGLAAPGAEDEAHTAAYLERVFERDLAGHPLLVNKSVWRSFPVVRCARWHAGPVVLLGDAAHTAHFSIGSGTKLAMEDAIALARALDAEGDALDAGAGPTRAAARDRALAAYESERRPVVESTQRAAQTSLEWFENAELYAKLPLLPFAASLLTRSLRVTHASLRARDPELARTLERDFAREARAQCDVNAAGDQASGAPFLQPFRLRGLVLPNRVVVSPMCQYMAREGLVDDWHLVHLGSRALGGAGLVMTEMTCVSADARITPGCAGLYADEHERAWRRVTEFVHERSSAKIGLQLGHAGRKGATRRPWHGVDLPLEDGEHVPPEERPWPLVAPSPLAYRPESAVPRPLEREGMVAIAARFAESASRAVRAGFDLVEVHMAHGYLLASFLSPLTNLRDDEFGGSLENRARFPLEVLRAVRRVVPHEFPVSVRISASDWLPGGISIEECVELARMLAAEGCDLVDVSSGQTRPDEKPVYGRLFQVPFADRIRHEAGVPTMAVGAISTVDDVDSVLVARRADLCALARAHLYDPYFTRHAAAEQGHALEWAPPYASLARYKPRPK